MEIIIPVVTFISGIVLAYIGYRYQVSRDKLSVKRERLLKNISKVERFLTLTLELEIIMLQLEETKRKQEDVHKELVRIKKESDEFELKSIHARPEEDEKREREASTKLNEKLMNLNEIGQILEVQEGKLKDMDKEFSISDIQVICKMIDPSNKLGRYLDEMSAYHLKLSKDRENASYIQKTRDLRYAILKLLDSKIK